MKRGLCCSDVKKEYHGFNQRSPYLIYAIKSDGNVLEGRLIL